MTAGLVMAAASSPNHEAPVLAYGAGLFSMGACGGLQLQLPGGGTAQVDGRGPQPPCAASEAHRGAVQPRR